MKSNEKIIMLLQEKGLSRNALALKAGITPQDLYAALAGRKPLFPGWRKRIADALNVPEAELFDDECSEAKGGE